MCDPSIFSPLATEYADIRIQQSTIHRLKIQNSEVQSVLTGSETGAGVRVLKDGSWGFSSTTDISSTGLKRAVERAHKMCLSEGTCVRLANVSPVTLRGRTLLQERSHDALIEPAKEMSSAVHCSPSIRSGEVQCSDLQVRKQFFSTDGSCIEQSLILVIFDLRVTARKNGKVTESRSSCAFTDVKSFKTAFLVEKAVHTAREALHQLDAGIAPRGQLPVILGPSLASVFIHEAVGHRMEADEVMRPHALMRDKTGSCITHPSLTVVDMMNNTQNWYQFDDEGVLKKDVVLIDKGRVHEFLHDCETACHFTKHPTGNSRASNYDTKPLIRMTNTTALGGDMSFEEMIEECDQGIFLDGFVGGAASAGGAFSFVSKGGYLIERGELTSPIGRTAVNGSTLGALGCISGVGKDVQMHSSECMKKGQKVTVGLGSPELFFSELRVGG